MFFVAAFGLLVAALPRLVNTPEFRTALAERAGAALGTPVVWKSLEIGFLPPRVILDEPVLVAQEASEPADASVRVQSIDLRLAWLPLLERRIAVESLVLRGLDLVVTRTAEGLVLPEILRQGAGDAAEEAPGEAEEAPDSAGAPDTFVLDLRALRLADARILVRDRTFESPLDVRLEGLSLVARGRSLGEPLAIEAASRVFANDRELGGVKASGKLDLEGEYALEFELDRILVAELRRFVSELDLQDGALSGTVFVAGAGSALSRITADVEIAGLGLRVREIDLRGDLGLRARRKDAEAIAFEASWASAAGGSAEITGERDPAGDVEGTAMLEAFEVEPFARLLGEDISLGGRASGEVSLAIASGRIARVESDLAIDSARYADGRFDAAGQLDLALGLEGLEPSDALRVQAVFAPERGGRLDVNATGTVSGALRSALRFDAFDVAVFAPLLPEDTKFEGRLTGDLELGTTAEREIADLLAKLRIGGARLVRGAADFAGDLSLDARGQGAGPITLAARATLASGGRVDLEGQVARSGALDLQARLEALDLALLAPLLASPELSVAGLATGRGTLSGPASELDTLTLDLTLADAALRSGETQIEGPLTLRLELAKPQAPTRRGTLVADLSEARAAQGETFVKPVGVRLIATTKLSGAESGRTDFESRIALHNINGLRCRARSVRRRPSC
ncbi:MAG: AsmA family protein [Myxococcota bacterium]